MADTFIILLLVVILLLTIIFKAHLTSKVRRVSKRLEELREQFSGTRQAAELDEAIEKMKVALKEIQTIREQTKPAAKEEKVVIPPAVEVKTTPLPPVKEEVKPAPELPVVKTPEEKPVEKPAVVMESIYPPAIPVSEKPSPYPPLEKPKKIGEQKGKKTDFERFIGENLINKIGIAILVIGLGLFVKFAIDKDWINEWGRVIIGLVAGGLLIGLGHFMRKSYQAFSSVLVGGGLAVFYFSVAIAFREYQLFSQTVAFVIMVVVTALAVFLSLRYNRLELAIISLVGGFATPLMVSNDAGNYVVLFTYLMILDAGMMVLAYFKKWNLINLLSFLFTIAFYGGWLFMQFSSFTPMPHTGALTFGALFFVVFFGMNIVNNIREREKFKGAEIGMILAATFLFFASGLMILRDMADEKFLGLFTGCLAAFNLLFAVIFYFNKRIDKSMVQLLIGQTLVFISLIAPIQLKGNYITLFWAAEAVLLLWFWFRSEIRLTGIASVVLILLMVGSLVMDWFNYYVAGTVDLPVFFNRAFITGFVCVVALAISLWKIMSETGNFFMSAGLRKSYLRWLTVFFIISLYIWLFAELIYQIDTFASHIKTQLVMVHSLNLLFIVGLLLWARILKSKPLFIGLSVVALLGIISYMTFFNFQAQFIRDFYLNHQGGFSPFLWHYFDAGMVILLVLILMNEIISSPKSLRSGTGSVFLWFATIVGVYIASCELINFSLFFNYDPTFEISAYVKQTQKLGLPILWGLCSFALLFIGMKRLRTLRVISLTLFFVTLLKLAIIDLRGISDAGRIAAFISLGIILLIMSFMYQKVKKLIFSDDPQEEKLPENKPEE